MNITKHCVENIMTTLVTLYVEKYHKIAKEKIKHLDSNKMKFSNIIFINEFSKLTKNKIEVLDFSSQYIIFKTIYIERYINEEKYFIYFLREPSPYKCYVKKVYCLEKNIALLIITKTISTGYIYDNLPF